MADIIIIGGGPAGVSAALTAKNRGKSVFIISNGANQSNLWKAHEITNYPGCAGMSGADILKNFRDQLNAANIKVLPGRYYQLGLAPATPVGARSVSAVIVESGAGATPYVAGPDYLLDAARGPLQILAGGTIPAGTIKVTYTKGAITWEGIRSGSSGELVGALRVVSDNATGANRDFFMPRVSLVPSGELPVIADGTDFASMQFDADVLKPANGEAIYVDGISVTP